MEYQALFGKDTYQLRVTETADGRLQVCIGDASYLVDVVNPSPHLYSLLIEGKSYTVQIREGEGATILVTLNQQTIPVELLDKEHFLRQKKPTHHLVSGRQEITAPMTGRVVEVLVEEGAQVEEGKPLVIIEAMKMETEIRSPITGTVRNVQVKREMAVEIGQLLLVVE